MKRGNIDIYLFSLIFTDAALLQPALGACAGGTINMKCTPNPTTNFTVFYFETLYGVKSVSSNPCEYRFVVRKFRITL